MCSQLPPQHPRSKQRPEVSVLRREKFQAILGSDQSGIVLQDSVAPLEHRL